MGINETYQFHDRIIEGCCREFLFHIKVNVLNYNIINVNIQLYEKVEMHGSTRDMCISNNETHYNVSLSSMSVVVAFELSM